ncbi:MAG: hypothetical protein PWK00_01835, partial [Coxiella burnetii]|nr:hypothetical protein [Coxiella burnetii]
GKKAEVEPVETKSVSFQLTFNDKSPREVFWKRPASSSFFSTNLGLLSKPNLPSAIKGTGDCGEF